MNSNDKLEQAVEAAAKAIYDRLPLTQGLTEKPKWVENGNSLKQDDARIYARAAILAADTILHPPAPATSEPDEAVGYLDIGAGGYIDIGSDLTDAQLSAMPKGRHMLGIIGTYGVDGYTRPQTEPAPDHIPGVGEMVEPVPAVGEVAAAWMHDDPNRVDVIHAKVKDLLIQSRDSAGHLHRPLDKAEHYTVPLYTRPQTEPAPAVGVEPILRIYAEGSMRAVTEWLDGARDLADGDHALYAHSPAPQVAPVTQDCALRDALRWTAGTLQSACSLMGPVREDTQFRLGNETRTVSQIIDAADTALESDGVALAAQAAKDAAIDAAITAQSPQEQESGS